MKRLTAILLVISLVGSIQINAQENSRQGKLTIASCQFPISDNINENYNRIKTQIIEAKLKGADIVHFSECALSGYVGTDFPNFEGYDWQRLKEESETIMSLAKELGIWVVLGSTHRLTKANKPVSYTHLRAHET